MSQIQIDVKRSALAVMKRRARPDAMSGFDLQREHNEKISAAVSDERDTWDCIRWYLLRLTVAAEKPPGILSRIAMRLW